MSTPAEKTLSQVIRNEAQNLLGTEHTDAAELLLVLARLVEGKTLYKAMGAPGDWGYGTPIGDALLALLREPAPDRTTPQWRAVEHEVPTHLHSVLGWVVGGPLVHGDPFADCVSYDPERDVWLQSLGTEDALVTVSHWMPLPSAPQAKGGAR